MTETRWYQVPVVTDQTGGVRPMYYELVEGESTVYLPNPENATRAVVHFRADSQILDDIGAKENVSYFRTPPVNLLNSHYGVNKSAEEWNQNFHPGE